jgi:tyrosine-protein kinase Etk/Wzc
MEFHAHRVVEQEPEPPARDVEGFVAAFRSRLRIYLGIVFLTAALAAGIALLLPSWYEARSTMLPPDENNNSSFGLLTGLLQSSALSTLGFQTTATPSDVFAEILKSRRISEAAIGRFGYERIYRRKGMDRTVREFQKHLDVDVNAAGLLTVTFEDREAGRAAQVTNFLVQELDRFNVESYKTRGKRLRIFLERRVAEVQGQLAAAEERLLAYERQRRVLSGGETEKLSGVSDILVQKFSLETQRAFVSGYSSPGSNELQNIDRQLGALNSQLVKLPQVKLEGTRLSLDVDVQRKLLVLMTTQFEDARMQETRDTPTVTVLDVATPPQLRARPRRSLIVAAAALAALLGCAAWSAFDQSRRS